MVRTLALSALVALGISLAAGPVQAQDGARVQMELARTDERIELAESIVAGSNLERARLVLDQAIELQNSARRAFESSRLAMALRATLDARTRADAAISIVRGEPNPERVLAQVERTRELLERARPRIDECSDERARLGFRSAVELQQRAELALESQRYLAALRLTLNARERAWRSLRACHLSEDPGENVERALQRTDDLLERASQEVAEHASPRAETALRQALELQQRAWAEFRAGHPEAALRLTHAARAAGGRAARSSRGQG